MDIVILGIRVTAPSDELRRDQVRIYLFTERVVSPELEAIHPRQIIYPCDLPKLSSSHEHAVEERHSKPREDYRSTE